MKEKDKPIKNVWVIKRYGPNTLSVTCNSNRREND
jgi:hypothetical protein